VRTPLRSPSTSEADGIRSGPTALTTAVDDVRVIAVRALEVLDHHPEILTGLVELPSPVSESVGAKGLQEPAKETRKTRAFIRRWIGDVRCYNVGPELRRTSFSRTSPSRSSLPLWRVLTTVPVIVVRMKTITPPAAPLRMPNKTSLGQLRVLLGHAAWHAPHRGFRSP
jgi:hypothetical protein